MTLPWIIAGAAAGLIVGPRIRASGFTRSTEPGQPPRLACPVCAHEILPDRWRWRSLLPVTGRCPSCRARIGPYPLLAELAAGLTLAVVVARASSAWELAALAWLALLAVPLAFIDVAVRRLPDPLTAACAGTLALLGAGALTSHQPGHLGRAAIGAAALACLYLALSVIRPGGMGLGDAKLAASVGAALGWTGWQALLTGTFTAFALAAGVSLDAKDARIHAAVDGRHVRNPAPARGIDQLIHQGIDRRDVRCPQAIYLLLPELRIAHPPVCHQVMIT